MEKGERFEKGGPGGKVNVGRWKDRWKGWIFEGKTVLVPTKLPSQGSQPRTNFSK